MTQIKVKRVYEEPSEDDGYRVLVDRLWPRGMKKEHLRYDEWAKGITPSPDLRKWFHADMTDHWTEFSAMYKKELDHSEAMKDFLANITSRKVVTLLYASREPVYNHARILQQYLEAHLKQ